MKRYILSLLLWTAALINIEAVADGVYNPSPTGFRDIVNEPAFEAGKLTRHIDCPVSYATGAYSLSIPLFSWDECGFPISLSLDYSPGIKAEDMAGIFGLGWSLGGLTGNISRQVTGLPDEDQDFRILDNDIDNYLKNAEAGDLIDLARGFKDAYHDKFYYTVPGYSGCFIIRSTDIIRDNIIELSGNDVTIECVRRKEYEGVAMGKKGMTPEEFTVTTPEGWVYRFEALAGSSKETKIRQINNTYVNTDYNVTTQWGLSSVTLPDAVSTIKVESESGSYSKIEKPELYSIRGKKHGMDTDARDIPAIENTVTTTRSGFAGIRSIEASRAKVSFIRSDDCMTGIVTNCAGDTVRRIEMEFDCRFENRKKLSSIAIYSGNELLDRRTFTYHDDSYSDKRPWACADFFGYSNRDKPVYIDQNWRPTIVDDREDGRKTEVGDMYDETEHNNSPSSGVIESIFKTDGTLNPHREYVFDHACSASLKEMTDANGLVTRITYEPNVAPLHFGRENDSVNVNIGIRVSSIETLDAISGRRKVRSFRYFDPVFSLPLETLRARDFTSHYGVAWSEMIGSLYGVVTCSQLTTMTASCRRPGMSAENTVIYYGAVEETVTGSDIDRKIKTRYEFDNTVSVNSQFSVNISDGIDYRRTTQPEYYLGYGIDGTLQHPVLGDNDITGGFSEVFGQKAPLIRCAMYEFDEKKGDFILREETINVYTHTDKTVYQVGLYCELLRRITSNINNHYYVFGGDADDICKGIATVESFRTYLDSTIVIRHYPGGPSRRLETRYVYPDRDLASIKNVFPDEESDIQAGALHRPVGTIVKCTGTTIAKYDLLSDHISTYGTSGSIIHTLPVLSRTIINSSKEFTTRTRYRKFGTNLLPYLYETVGKDGEPVIDRLEVDSYNSRRQPLKIRRHAAPTMVYTYQADGQALASAGIDSTSLIRHYTHIPLVGYTSATTPAGNMTSYSYRGSRLSRISDRYGNPVKEYDYHMFSPDDYVPGYIRETTYLKAGGKNPMSAVQLFDCYGEPYATIAENASSDGAGIVSLTRLDGLGRPVRQYLPFPFTGADDLSLLDLALNGETMADSFYDHRRPYTATEYIPGSASATPAVTTDAGSDRDTWKTTVAEMCNNTTDPSLRCLRLTMGGVNALRCQGYWPAGSLDVTEVTDADGARVLEFADFRGLKLLSRRILDGERLDTYYVYDEWGNLRMAIPPEAAASLPATTRILNAVSDATLLDYAYHYVYDEANRLVSKKLPGAEKITYAYDADGLPAFTQDGNMRKSGKAMFTLHDKAGRVVLTGTCSSSAMTSAGTVRMRARYSASEQGVDSTRYVTDVELPSARMLSATYYDAVPAYLDVSCQRSDVLGAPAGLVTAQVDRVLGEAVRSRVHTVSFYDGHERPVYTVTAEADNSHVMTTTDYDFAGNPVKVSSITWIGFSRFADIYTYTYDQVNRPLTVTLSHDDGGGARIYPLVSNRYDNLGRLRSNGAPGKAAATFGYDMRSSLNSISSNHFIQTLSRGDGTFPSKSGRITRNDILLTGRHLTFNYQYDQAGRLKKASAALENPSIDYTEEFDYDLNTNITGLRRYGAKNPATGALLDDLTMTYQGNQLRYISDDATDYPYEASLDFRAKAPAESTPGASVAAPFGLLPGGLTPGDSLITRPTKPIPGPTYSADYAYDANGNMTQDRHSSITSIKYNELNLLQTVTYEGGVVNTPVSRIVYDASGRKHIVRNGALKLGKFSGDETRYIGRYIMINDTVDRLQTPYGYLRDGVYHAYVFDYQGNVMAVVAGDDVVQTNLYYSDGLPMNTSTGTTANAFKYTSKELSLYRGLPVYDFTARHTLPAAGNSFRTMDPLAEKYHGISPYSFCMGDPINNYDPTGMETYRIQFDGQKIDKIDDGSDNQTIIFYNEETETTPIVLEPGTIQDIYHVGAKNGTKYLYILINGDENGQAVFESAANIQIDKAKKSEYALWQVGEKGSSGLNYVSTSGENRDEKSATHIFNKQLQFGYTLRRHVHSHTLYSIPSGFHREENVGDKYFAQELYRISKQTPVLEIYTDNKYIQYSPNSTYEGLMNQLNKR